MSESSCEDRFLEVPGARLRYRDEGRGPALVLLHGWTLDLDMWQRQCEALRDAFRLVRFDRRGFGLSTGEPAIAADVADLTALCDRLALRRVAVLGMSQGARVAIAFAANAPERVASLVLHGPPDLDPAAAADVPLAHYRALIRREGVDAFRAAWSAHALMQLVTRDERAHALVRTMLARYRGLDLLAEAASTAASTDWRRLDAPALVLTGAQDLASRARAADFLAAHMRHAERVTVPGAGHLANLDDPDAYNSLVRSFLERHGAVRPSQHGA